MTDLTATQAPVLGRQGMSTDGASCRRVGRDWAGPPMPGQMPGQIQGLSPASADGTRLISHGLMAKNPDQHQPCTSEESILHTDMAHKYCTHLS
jgi:hypothetical protein